MPFVYKYAIIYSMKNKNFLAIFIALLTILINVSPTRTVKADYYFADTFINSVVTVAFGESISDQDLSKKVDMLYKSYQTGDISVKNYIEVQSGNKLDFSTKLLGAKGNNFLRLNSDENYYKPRYSFVNGTYEVVNEQGYDNRYFNKYGKVVSPDYSGGLPHVERAVREQQFITEVLSLISEPKDYIADGNNDGVADGFVIITCADSYGIEDIFYPHMGVYHNFESDLSSLYYYEDDLSDYKLQQLNLADTKVSGYNILSLNDVTAKRVGDYYEGATEEQKKLYNVGLLAHESMHLLGFADYYSYENDLYESVGEMDVMGTTNVVPQNMLGYMRFKAGWIDYDSFLYLNSSGRYTLPLASEGAKNSIAKIVLSSFCETGEYFMAEFRSSSLSSTPYDGCLSGDGLVIYRVKPSASYQNAKGEISSTEYGNMYGEDEVYVYRVGNPLKTQKIVSPTGISYSLLGGEESVITWDGGYYLKDNYGTTDVTKTVNDLKSSLIEESETIISYSNGSNSGIRFENITVDRENKCVSFDLFLPEEISDYPLIAGDITFEDYHYGKQIKWQSVSKNSTAYILMIRSTNRLKEFAEKGIVDITLEQIKKGKYPLYKTIYSRSLSVAEQNYILPKVSDECLVFIAMESSSGASIVEYLGYIQNPSPTFKQYLFTKTDPLYLIIAIGCACLIFAFVFVAILIKKGGDKKRVYRKK